MRIFLHLIIFKKECQDDLYLLTIFQVPLNSKYARVTYSVVERS